MIAKYIAEGLYSIPIQKVNVFVIISPQGVTLIDTGFPQHAETILKALEELHLQANDVHKIILTHAHPDHIGNAAVMKQLTGAEVFIHALDAEIAEKGGGFRPVYPAPGFINWFMKKFILGKIRQVEPVTIDHFLTEEAALPVGDGELRIIHIPGHCLGQTALLWNRHGGVLFVADACMHLNNLKYSFVYEDIETGRQSLTKLAGLDFQVACFGHGATITKDADKVFKKKWLIG
jgi:glyoxylase-like metal-dependent hydrolase (beta-lactamase superfamily II)